MSYRGAAQVISCAASERAELVMSEAWSLCSSLLLKAATFQKKKKQAEGRPDGAQ
jgi:hypothetical protein